MSVIETHHCPRCDLRFANLAEVDDHMYRDHDIDLTAGATASTVEGANPAVTGGRIVVPLDPLHPPSRAAQVALTVARQAGLSVELVAAVPPGLDEIATKSHLDTVGRELHGAGRSVSSASLGTGDPVEKILDHIQTADASMLCMDTRSRTAVAEIAFGSVAQAVVRRTPVPVLVCGPHIEPAERYDRVLVGLDGSDLAEKAMNLGIGLAQAINARVELLCVFDPGVPLPSDLTETGYLSRMSHSSAVPIDDFDALHHHDAGRALAEAASTPPGAILVVGTQGKTGFQRLRLGSVALAAVRHAACPVLLVPPSTRLQTS